MEPPTYLAKKFPHERDSHIVFDEGPHIYTIDGDSSFMSVTTWNHSHFSHFDADASGQIVSILVKPEKKLKLYGTKMEKKRLKLVLKCTMILSVFIIIKMSK